MSKLDKEVFDRAVPFLAKIHFFLFISLLVILLLNLLIAMMGDTYAKVSKTILTSLMCGKDCRDQERVDEAVGQDCSHRGEVHLTWREAEAAEQVRGN